MVSPSPVACLPKETPPPFMKSMDYESVGEAASNTGGPKDYNLKWDGEETSSQTVSWTPQYWLTEWTDTSHRNRYTVSILLPSGVTKVSDFKARVCENNFDLEIKVLWPDIFYDVGMAQKLLWTKKGRKMPEAKVTAMEMTVEKMKRALVAGQTFNSTCKISLPKEIETTAELEGMGSDDGARMVLVDLVIKGHYAGGLSADEFLIAGQSDDGDGF